MHQKLALFLLAERKHLLGILHELHKRPPLSDMDSDTPLSQRWPHYLRALSDMMHSWINYYKRSTSWFTEAKPNHNISTIRCMRSISFSPLYLHQTRLMWQTLYSGILSVKVKFVVLIVEAGIPTPVEALGWDFLYSLQEIKLQFRTLV